MSITEINEETLKFLYTYHTENMRFPTIREMGKHFGIAFQAIVDRLTALENKGLITRDKKISRGTRITTSGIDYLKFRGIYVDTTFVAWFDAHPCDECIYLIDGRTHSTECTTCVRSNYMADNWKKEGQA